MQWSGISNKGGLSVAPLARRYSMPDCHGPVRLCNTGSCSTILCRIVEARASCHHRLAGRGKTSRSAGFGRSRLGEPWVSGELGFSKNGGNGGYVRSRVLTLSLNWRLSVFETRIARPPFSLAVGEDPSQRHQHRQ